MSRVYRRTILGFLVLSYCISPTAAVTITPETINVGDGNLTGLSWLNPQSGQSTLGTSLDLQGNTLQNVGTLSVSTPLTGGNISRGAVNTTHIVAGAITAPDLGPDSITAASDALDASVAGSGLALPGSDRLTVGGYTGLTRNGTGLSIDTAVVPRKNRQETISGFWTFTNNMTITGNLRVSGNMTSTTVQNLTVNGSFMPATGYDNVFDVGSPTRRWQDGYFGGNLILNGSINLASDQYVDGVDVSTPGNGLTVQSNAYTIDTDGTLTFDASDRLQVATNGIGSTELASGAVTHTTIGVNAVNRTQLRASGCTDEQVLKWDSAATAWTCADDEGSGGSDDQNLKETLVHGNVANRSIVMGTNGITGPGNAQVNFTTVGTANTLETDGSGGGWHIWDSSNGANLAAFSEGGGVRLRNPVADEDVLRANASGGSNVAIPNGDLQMDGNSIVYSDGITIGNSGTSTAHTNAIAVGKGAEASDTSAIAIGESADAASRGVAMGYLADADAENAIALGDANAGGPQSIAIGDESAAAAESAVAIGYFAQAPNSYEATFGALDGTHALDINVTGDATIHGTCSGCADIAELYNASEPVESGDVVMVDEDRRKTVKKAEKTGRGKMIGVVTTSPAILFEEERLELARDYTVDPWKPGVALTGRVPVKISLENGAIQPGDPITVSSEDGVGMKAVESGMVVGTALEPYTANTSDQQILVFVNPHYRGTGDRIATLQQQNNRLEQRVRQQAGQIDALARAVCQADRSATVC